MTDAVLNCASFTYIEANFIRCMNHTAFDFHKYRQSLTSRHLKLCILMQFLYVRKIYHYEQFRNFDEI